MARMLTGSLVLSLIDKLSGPAKGAAKSLQDVAAAAKGLNNAGAGAGLDKIARGMKEINDRASSQNVKAWSLGFEKTLARLKVSAEEMQRVKASWIDLQNSFAKDNLAGTLRGMRTAEWRNATVAHLMGVRVALDQTGAAAAKMGSRTTSELNKVTAAANKSSASMNRLKNAISVAVIGGAGAYGTGFMIRGATQAPADMARERFRQGMAGMTPAEVAANERAAFGHAGKYRSVLPVQSMEMSRTARSMMGSNERGLEILPDLVRGLVTLQSVKGVDAAADDMNRMLRGIDNLGQNDKGGLGVIQTRQIIDGLIKAAQVEGKDFNPGDLYKFARRAKIAGPGLSTEFIYGTAPALMQDSGADRIGDQISSAYSALVIGSNAVAGRANLAAQRKLGLRSGEGKGTLVDAELFGKDPFAWTEKHLVPALAKSGVDMTSDTAIAEAIAQLSRNTNATGFLTRMVQQRGQIARNKELYSQAQGTAAADDAAGKDPYVAFLGMINSLKNLSDAVIGPLMPTIVAGLNSLSGGITSLADAVRGMPDVAKHAITLGTVVVGLAVAFKIAAATLAMARGIMAIPAAVAAGGAAAAAAGGTAAAGGAAAQTAARFGLGGVMAGGVAIGGAALGAYYAGQANREFHKNNGNETHNISRNARRAANRRLYDETNQIRMMNDGGISAEAMIAAESRSAEAGQNIKNNLSVTATPAVDLTALQQAEQLARSVLSLLGQIGAASQGAKQNMNSAFSDFGVAP